MGEVVKERSTFLLMLWA